MSNYQLNPILNEASFKNLGIYSGIGAGVGGIAGGVYGGVTAKKNYENDLKNLEIQISKEKDPYKRNALKVQYSKLRRIGLSGYRKNRIIKGGTIGTLAGTAIGAGSHDLKNRFSKVKDSGSTKEFLQKTKTGLKNWWNGEGELDLATKLRIEPFENIKQKLSKVPQDMTFKKYLDANPDSKMKFQIINGALFGSDKIPFEKLTVGQVNQFLDTKITNIIKASQETMGQVNKSVAAFGVAPVGISMAYSAHQNKNSGNDSIDLANANNIPIRKR